MNNNDRIEKLKKELEAEEKLQKESEQTKILPFLYKNLDYIDECQEGFWTIHWKKSCHVNDYIEFSQLIPTGPLIGEDKGYKIDDNLYIMCIDYSQIYLVLKTPISFNEQFEILSKNNFGKFIKNYYDKISYSQERIDFYVKQKEGYETKNKILKEKGIVEK